MRRRRRGGACAGVRGGSTRRRGGATRRPLSARSRRGGAVRTGLSGARGRHRANGGARTAVRRCSARLHPRLLSEPSAREAIPGVSARVRHATGADARASACAASHALNACSPTRACRSTRSPSCSKLLRVTAKSRERGLAYAFHSSVVPCETRARRPERRSSVARAAGPAYRHSAAALG